MNLASQAVGSITLRCTSFALLLVTAGGASPRTFAGDCDWTLGSVQAGFVPDLDQLRQGVVNDGYMLCAPTAAINWMAWLDAHGYPSVMPFPPTNWQAQASFNSATASILEMAGYMHTDFFGGTTMEDSIEGVETWLDTYADADDFTVSFLSPIGNWVPDPFWAWSAAKWGSLVCGVAGWYQQEPYPFGAGSAWIRQGGHIFSVNGLLCTPSGDLDAGMQFRFRDPADDYFQFDLANQSAFLNRQYATSLVSGRFCTKKNNPQASDFHQRTHHQMGNYATYYASLIPDEFAMYEGFMSIRPLGGYTTGAAGLGLTTLNPHHLDYDTSPVVFSHPGAASIIVEDLAVDSATQEYVILSRDSNGALISAVRAFNPATGTLRTIHTGVAPRRAVYDRRGNLYLLDGPQLVRVDLPGGHTGSGVPASGAHTPPVLLTAIGWDDQHDVLYAYSASGGSVLIYPTVPGASVFPGVTPVVAPLPGNAPTGSVSMAVDPRDAGVWLHSESSRTAAKYKVNPATGAATIVESFSNNDLLGAAGLDVSRGGRVYFTKSQTILEYSKTSAGNWVQSTQTPFAGLPAHGLFRLDRGRSNYIPGETDTLQIVPPVPPCARFGDINWDGVVSAADLALLLGQWGACGQCAADLNSDGGVNSADLATLLGGWGACR